LEAVKTEQSQLDEKEIEMRDMVARAESKRAWFFDMKEWMETIATFLDEKVGGILCILAFFSSLSLVVPRARKA
jgi:hypothetical protein